jgi:hypothetical protein
VLDLGFFGQFTAFALADIPPDTINGGLAQPFDRGQCDFNGKHGSIPSLMHPLESMYTIFKTQTSHAFGLDVGELSIRLIIGRYVTGMQM